MAKIICRSCNKSYHDTTDEFDADRQAHGAMFKYTGPATFARFPEKRTTQTGHLECPGCGTSYTAGNGRVIAKVVGHVQKRTSTPVHEIGTAVLPAAANATIITMYKNGHTATEIAAVVGSNKQAITRRIMALKTAGVDL